MGASTEGRRPTGEISKLIQSEISVSLHFLSSRASLILKGYNSVNKLIKAEKQALQPFIVYAAAGVAFWRHKNFNYIAPDNNLKDSYLKMKNFDHYLLLLIYHYLLMQLTHN